MEAPPTASRRTSLATGRLPRRANEEGERGGRERLLPPDPRAGTANRDAEGTPVMTKLPFIEGGQHADLPFAVLWLVLEAIYFTLRMGFVQFKLVGHAIQVTRGKYDDPDDEGEVSHFEALTAALSATVDSTSPGWPSRSRSAGQAPVLDDPHGRPGPSQFTEAPSARCTAWSTRTAASWAAPWLPLGRLRDRGRSWPPWQGPGDHVRHPLHRRLPRRRQRFQVNQSKDALSEVVPS